MAEPRYLFRLRPPERAGEARHLSTSFSSYPTYRRGECMKRLLLFPGLSHVAGHLAGARFESRQRRRMLWPIRSPLPRQTGSATQERLFFPKDWYWGWAQFDIAPPHNEIDPNLCAANAGTIRRRELAVQRLRAVQISGSVEIASLRPDNRDARLNVLLRPEFSVRQKHSADALYLVVERHWHGVLMGRWRRSAKAI